MLIGNLTLGVKPTVNVEQNRYIVAFASPNLPNRFLNLEPVARGMAEQLGWQAFLIDNPDDDSHGVFTSSWVLITKNADVAEDPEVALAVDSWSKKDWVLKWTDDYSGIWSVLRF